MVLPSLSTGVILRNHAPVQPQPTATSSASMFKVHGSSDNSVFIVGQRGSAFHFDGSQLQELAVPTRLPLIAVHGVADDAMFAVGGGASGLMLRYNGQEFVDESPAEVPSISGVFAIDRDEAYAVGFNGRVFHRKAGLWAELEAEIPTFEDLHSVWVDELGGLWAVGGRLSVDPPTSGVLIHFGDKIATGLE